MCTMTIRDGCTDTPESHCSECDMRFHLYWNRNPIFDNPEYCPFCGSEIDETVFVDDGVQ